MFHNSQVVYGGGEVKEELNETASFPVQAEGSLGTAEGNDFGVQPCDNLGHMGLLWSLQALGGRLAGQPHNTL